MLEKQIKIIKRKNKERNKILCTKNIYKDNIYSGNNKEKRKVYYEKK